MNANTFHKEGKVGWVYYAHWNGKGGNKRKKLENKLCPSVSTPFNVNLWPFRQRYKVKIIRQRERKEEQQPYLPNFLLFLCVHKLLWERRIRVALDVFVIHMWRFRRVGNFWYGNFVSNWKIIEYSRGKVSWLLQ